MKMQRVSSPKLNEPAPGTWSNCRVYGNQVFIAGMTAGDGKGGVLGDGSVYSLARETFTKIKHLIEAAGGTMNDVIRVDIYVTDIKQREDVWKARREFFSGDFPTSTLVEVRALAIPQLMVEVNAIGFLGGSAG
ncbi:MAG: RidA family protein [Candidatus Rokuibacteriota bacterium]|nr:MAG: RidA family protein [Candidatus Rokubacteria bacterium]